MPGRVEGNSGGGVRGTNCWVQDRLKAVQCGEHSQYIVITVNGKQPLKLYKKFFYNF